jgi:PilZ domain
MPFRRTGRRTDPNPRPSGKSNPNKRISITERNAARAFVRLPVRITLESAPTTQHVGFIRDISPRGMFFYSDFTVPAGQSIVLALEYLDSAQKVTLKLSGKVIRVEQTPSKQAVGIAMIFDSVHDEVPRAPLPKRRTQF